MSEPLSPNPVDARTSPIFGAAGFAAGALALLVVLISFFAGPFAPQDTLTVSLGELASETAKSSLRDMFGLAQPEAEPRPWDIDRVLATGAGGLAALAMVLSPVALIREEPKRWAAAAFTLGASAIAFQVFTWLIIIATVLIIVSLFKEMWAEALASPFAALGGLLTLFSCGG